MRNAFILGFLVVLVALTATAKMGRFPKSGLNPPKVGGGSYVPISLPVDGCLLPAELPCRLEY